MVANPWLEAMGIRQWTLRNAPVSAMNSTAMDSEPKPEVATKAAETARLSDSPTTSQVKQSSAQPTLSSRLAEQNDKRLLVIWQGRARAPIALQRPQSEKAELVQNIVAAIGVADNQMAMFCVPNIEQALAELRSPAAANQQPAHILLFGKPNTAAQVAEQNGKQLIVAADLTAMANDRAKKAALWKLLKPLKDAGTFEV